jgi:RimJ/RimL family protein N-acetyltransferase
VHRTCLTYPDLVIITTERLLLRPFGAADAATLSAYRSDERVARYQSWEPPVGLDDARRSIAAMAAADPGEPGWFQYAVVRSQDGRHIGDVGVHLHENLMQADIGFSFAVAHQGRGYATEAVRAVLSQLFTVQGLLRVSAECDARNLPSARLLERVGFRREGLRPRFTWTKGEWTDDLLFGLLADDFVD